MHTIKFGDLAQANWVTDLIEAQVDPGGHVELHGRNVTLTAEAIAVLAALPEDRDGHYDGTHVWIGGTAYLVR